MAKANRAAGKTPRADAPRASKGQGKMARKAKAGETALPRKGKGRVTQPEEDTDAPEEVSSNRRAAAQLPDVPEAKRKRKRQRQRLDDDVLAAVAEGGGAVNDATPGEGDAGAIIVAAPRASKSYRGKRILLGGNARDEKIADGGVKVKKLRSKAVLKGREAPAEVKSFLQDHFFGDRLRRTTGPANRRRGMRAARVFVAK